MRKTPVSSRETRYQRVIYRGQPQNAADVATLEARHAFQGDQTTVAFALLQVYFPQELVDKLRSDDAWWNKPDYSGILGAFSEQLTQTQINTALNNWIINLAKVGFHLCQA